MLSVETVKGVITLRSVRTWLSAMGIVALLPMALACDQDPAPSYLRSALTLAAWGLWLVAVSTLRGPQTAGRTSGQMALYMAVSTLGASALVAPLWAGLPWGIALPAVMNLAAAALVITVTARCVYSGNGELLFDALCGGIVVAGLLNAAVALVQVFAPQYCDGDWIAPGGGYLGRAAGNLRQANHLGTLMAWAIVAALWLGERRPKDRPAAIVMVAIMVFASMLSESRSAVVAMLALPAWGLFDRGLSRATRITLVLSPLTYVAFRYGISEWAAVDGHVFGSSQRLKQMASDGAVLKRFGVWQETWGMILSNPWFGVGFGEFHFAWILTPSIEKTVYFDHPHNIILYILVCLGIPLGGLVVILLLYAFIKGVQYSIKEDAPAYRKPAMLMIWTITVHSLLEYPLWYSYFLLPTALFIALVTCRQAAENSVGYGMSGTSEPEECPVFQKLIVPSASLILVASSAWAIYDYQGIATLYSDKTEYPFDPEHVKKLQSSILTGHFADLEAVKTSKRPSEMMQAFTRDPHHLMQPELLKAWSIAHSETGDVERARFLAARLAELPPNSTALEFFAACYQKEASQPLVPFQCTPPSGTLSFRDFR